MVGYNINISYCWLIFTPVENYEEAFHYFTLAECIPKIHSLYGKGEEAHWPDLNIVNRESRHRSVVHPIS